MEFHGYKVYLDARPELFQKKINGKEDVYTEYLELTNFENLEKFVNKYNFSHILVYETDMLAVYLQGLDDYEIVVDGDRYYLFEKITKKGE